MQEFELKNLTLITTNACNLNCKYCTIAKNTNAHSAELHQKTAQALKDGTFLENVKKVYKKLGCATAQVETLDFWGQEPTLTLDYITMNLSNWLATFPNLTSILFSTNGVAFTDKIIDFIKELDNTTTHKITLDIQYSWDGQLSTAEYRQADNDVIIQNAYKLVNALNGINLRHVHVNLQFHGVLSIDLIKQLDTIEKVQQYFITSNKIVHDIVETSYNKNVFIAPILSLGFQNPVPATTQDGLDFHRFFRAGLTTDGNQLAPNQDGVLIQPMIDLTRILEEPLLQPDYFEQIIRLFDSNLDLVTLKKELRGFSRQLLCGAYSTELKIMYDGTLLSCQNYMFNTKEEDIKDDNSVENQTKKYLVKKHHHINPLDDDFTRKDFDMWREAYVQARTDSFLYTFEQTVSLMYYLSLAKQIHPQYAQDFRKLVLHAFILTPVRDCPYNNQISTGSLYNKDAGMLRWYCNGMMDEVETFLNFKREKGANLSGIR